MRAKCFYRSGTEEEDIDLGRHLDVWLQFCPRAGETLWCLDQPKGCRSGWEILEIVHWVGPSTPRHTVVIYLAPLEGYAETIVAQAREAA